MTMQRNYTIFNLFYDRAIVDTREEAECKNQKREHGKVASAKLRQYFSLLMKNEE